MADKREDKGTDEGQEKQKPFIREKIVRQPPSGRQIMRKILMTGACAVVFGTAAAVCFSAVKPIADRAFGPEETEQEPITIAKDEPEAQQPVQTECAPVPEETEPVEDMVRSEMEKYPYSMDDLNRLYGNLNTLVEENEGCLASVHSIQM